MPGKIISIFILSLWVTGAYAMLKAEKLVFKVAPVLFSMNYDQKKGLFDGPIYDLSRDAVSMMPPEGSAYILGPAQNAEFYHLKSRYYLYPRQVKYYTSLDIDKLMEEDYLIVYSPDDRRYEDDLKNMSSLELRSDYKNEPGKSFMAIYKIKNDQ